ncbi:hypothetical protein [Malaciobacter mytili]|uniref:Uncharacterized protein n=1 Tax=Malaciobacter mytili LMG 24559 TaxID=1032238 RepID=A0AAX2AEF1_9BACT|nr:hypothetical protein [Malaciobacter mytili]AXH13790.1 hypothetical protein AMYT_0166 [Malaciobacter mytili LMG 24559]RXK12932.1 hypothetical protein CP985_13980 [Malaciobacter mytili LMG 24559]
MKYILLISLLFLALNAKDKIDYSNIQIEQKKLITELPKEKNYKEDDLDKYENIKQKLQEAPKHKESIVTYKNNAQEELQQPFKENHDNFKSNFKINEETKEIEKIEVEVGKKF